MLVTRDQVLITNDDLHAVLSICSILCLIVPILAILGRLFTKILMVRKLVLDDFVAFSALVRAPRPNTISGKKLIPIAGSKCSSNCSRLGSLRKRTWASLGIVVQR